MTSLCHACTAGVNNTILRATAAQRSTPAGHSHACSSRMAPSGAALMSSIIPCRSSQVAQTGGVVDGPHSAAACCRVG